MKSNATWKGIIEQARVKTFFFSKYSQKALFDGVKITIMVLCPWNMASLTKF